MTLDENWRNHPCLWNSSLTAHVRSYIFCRSVIEAFHYKCQPAGISSDNNPSLFCGTMNVCTKAHATQLQYIPLNKHCVFFLAGFWGFSALIAVTFQIPWAVAGIITSFSLQVFRGTITDTPNFDPSADAEALYNAMKGIGECLTPPSFLATEAQRSSFSFPTCSLTDPTKNEHSSHDRSTVRVVFCHTDASLCSLGSDKEAILDLITTRSNAQRQEITAAYKCSYGKVQEKNSIQCNCLGIY